MGCSPAHRVNGVADWRDEFVRGGYAATHKFIPGLSNAWEISGIAQNVVSKFTERNPYLSQLRLTLREY
jgi:hypothetical protein